MHLLLTSFGLSHLPRRDEANPDIFYRMPPASISNVNQLFSPDYAVLLLADSVILDERTYGRLTGESHPAYKEMAETARFLHDEGFIRIENFDAIVEKHQALLEEMLQRDLKELDPWVPILREACESWHEFVSSVSRPLQREIYEGRIDAISDEEKEKISAKHVLAHHTAMYIHNAASQTASALMMVELAMHSSRMRQKSEYRKHLRNTIEEYLSYVNANLVVCNELGCGLHDWYDFHPFYRDKFLRVGFQTPPLEEEKRQIKRLFTVPFPDLTFWEPSLVVQAIEDKRIQSLRDLVDRAVKGEEEFDGEFALRTMKEVLKMEESIGKIRNIVSYATMPLGFIPVAGTPIQKVAEEAVVRPVAHRKRRPLAWYYLISELSEKHRRRAETGSEAEQGAPRAKISPD